MKHASYLPEPAPQALSEEQVDTLIEILSRDPDRLAQVISRAGPEDERGDGWTPPRRRLFLSVLAETGRVDQACYWSSLSRQSAYRLRARDPLFAAGWAAAAEIARTLLADTLFEKAIDGITETIVKEGEVVAERHRFDSRLSVAVLNRLDKRCDRAAEQGARHLPAIAQWDEFLNLIGRGDEAGAEDLLDAASERQPCKLPLGESPTDAQASPPDEPAEDDLSTRCWQDDHGNWLTNFPPPPGFCGYEKGHWRDYGYERDCTDEEADLLDANDEAANAEEEVEDAALRDRWFAQLAGDEDDAPVADGEAEAIADARYSRSDASLTSDALGSPVKETSQ
ncbi:hypothetical protein G7077_02140 [Sphingomonas piscis]|uniref:Uncharacterized protein n=1 Tax=Sphingomonas piscis TaxID=2714943 RepID=A0A6G7YMC9_9SPHN|nr:hypothetical protein [Sphingomonas piscis]QIK77892.1 hypothetical protein G7077_02140 [Sphingomonas piscis]